MSEVKKPRRTVTFVGHHDIAITDDIAKDIMRRFRPGSVSDVTRENATEKEDEAQFGIWKSYREPRTLRFYYPRPRRPGETYHEGGAEVVVATWIFPKFEMDNRQMAYVPLFEREKKHWFEVTVGRTNVNDDSPFDMAWFFEKVHRAFPVFRPDFGFGDIESSIVRNIGDDPRRRAWPVMLYGPQMVEQMGGREHVLETPVWNAEELADRSIWLQVAENPFKATGGQLKKAAVHLKLPEWM